MLLRKDEIDKVITQQARFLNIYPMWRKGQAFFNALYLLHPHIADEIRGGIYDPFYNDNKIQECINFISE